MNRKEEFFMNEYRFRSVFAPFINSFLSMKETMGFQLRKYKMVLKEFDVFFIDNKVTEPYITCLLMEKWRSTRVNDSAGMLYVKISTISQLCKYLCHLGHPCFIPRIPPKPSDTFIPYVFTHEQIQLIFKTADALVLTHNRMDSLLFVIPVLIRLLYSTGIRIGEAIAIKNGDVDFDRQFITIRKTKNQQDRLAPLNTDMLQVMLQYREARNRLPLPDVNHPDRFFFTSLSAKSLHHGTVYNWFKIILKKCGIPHIGMNHGPRIHDLRHTCAIHSLMKQVKEGADIYCLLPVISVFLGHKTIKGTEQYVRLTQEMFPEIIQMEQTVTSFVFPSQIKIEMDYEK
jgi:integrase